MADIILKAPAPATNAKVQAATTITMTANNTTKARTKAMAQKFNKHNRFSETEKELLYGMFRQYKNIIDIKLRKNSYSTKQSEVRSCWDIILKRFNDHPDTRQRTMRQIQKFWLNSKLRNRIPDIEDTKEVPLPPLIRCVRKESIDKPLAISKIELSCHSIGSENENDQQIEHMIEYITSDPQEMTASEQEPDETMNPIQQTMGNNFSTSRNNLNHTTISQSSGTPSFIQRSSRRLFCGSDCGADDDHNHQNAIIDDEEIQQQLPEEELATETFANKQQLEAIEIHAADDPLTSRESGRRLNRTMLAHERKMNQLRQQELEFRVKESQLRCELQQISVTRAQEELQQSREIHMLRISEMQMKLDCMKTELRTNFRGTGVARTTLL